MASVAAQLTAIGSIPHATAAETTTSPSEVTTMIHPLVVPESLEEHGSSSSTEVRVKTHPKLAMAQWAAPVPTKKTTSNDTSSTESQNQKQKAEYITFFGDVAPMFTSFVADQHQKQSNEQNSNTNNSSSSSMKPLESLHPLRLTSLRALCSALLSASDRGISIKSLSQRIFDGDKAMSSGGGVVAAVKNPFRGLIEDLGAASVEGNPFASPSNSAAAGGGASTSSAVGGSASSSEEKKKKKSAATSSTMSRLLQWGLFLSNAAGHVTPMAFIESSAGNASAIALNYGITVTPQQLKEKTFELQIRFYSFIDEKLFVACHMPSTTATSATPRLNSPSTVAAAAAVGGGPVAVLGGITTRILTNLIKQQKAAVTEAATSVHGMIPLVISATSSSSSSPADGNSVSTTLSMIRDTVANAMAASGVAPHPSLEEEEDNDNAGDCCGSDIGGGGGSVVSGVSGVSGAATSTVGVRRSVPLSTFLKLFGSRYENTLKYRAITLIAAANFSNVFLALLKYVPFENLKRLKALAADPTAGNNALFSSAGLLAANAPDMGWLDALLKAKSGEGSCPPLLLFVEKILLSGSNSIAEKKDESFDFNALLQAAAAQLITDYADHQAANPASNPLNYQTETAYAQAQRPMPNFLSAMLERFVDARNKSSEDAAEGKKNNSAALDSLAAIDLTGTSGANAPKTASSLDIMVIQSQRSGVGSPTVSTAAAGAEALSSPAAAAAASSFSSAAKLEALKDWFDAMRHGDDAVGTYSAANLSVAMGAALGTLNPLQLSPSAAAAKSAGKASANNTAAATTAAPKRAREEAGSSGSTSATTTATKAHRVEAIAVPKMHDLADLPFKVRFSWAPYYENPTAAADSAAAAVAAAAPSSKADTLWARTSHAEQRWVEAIQGLVSVHGLEFAFKPQQQSGGASAAAPSMDAPKDVKALLDLLASVEHGAELNAALCVKRGTATTPAASAAATAAPIGVVDWVLCHSDAVLNNKLSLSSSSSAAGAASADPLALPVLNNMANNQPKLLKADAASAAMSNLASYLGKQNAKVEQLSKDRGDLIAFKNVAQKHLDAFEALVLELAAFVEGELAKVGGVNGTNSGVSFDVAAMSPIGLVFKGLGVAFEVVVGEASTSAVVPVPNLDNGLQQLSLRPKKASSIANVDDVPSTCLSTKLVADIAAFSAAHSKRARRLKGLVRLAEEAAKAVGAELQNLKDEMWLVSA